MKLSNFQHEKLTITELHSVNGGLMMLEEGSTTSRRTHTSCTGSDSDSRRTDSD